MIFPAGPKKKKKKKVALLGAPIYAEHLGVLVSDNTSGVTLNRDAKYQDYTPYFIRSHWQENRIHLLASIFSQQTLTNSHHKTYVHFAAILAVSIYKP